MHDAEGTSPQVDTPNDHHSSASIMAGTDSDGNEQQFPLKASLKRKLDQSLDESNPTVLMNNGIAQHLPPQHVLQKVVEFYCLSFHHWIPNIHKQRLQKRVRDAPEILAWI